MRLVMDMGFKRTRNKSRRGTEPLDSACAIVNKALGPLGHPMTERNVEEICEKHLFFFEVSPD